MEIIKELLKTTWGKIIALSIIVLLVGLAVFAWFMINQSETIMDGSLSCSDSDPSGQTLCTTDAETEETAQNTPLLVGFGIFYDFGFSASQQTEIANTVRIFFAEHHPNVSKVSYINNSFQYDGDETDKSFFAIITNTNKKFTVHLNTNWSYATIEINISEL